MTLIQEFISDCKEDLPLPSLPPSLLLLCDISDHDPSCLSSLPSVVVYG